MKSSLIVLFVTCGFFVMVFGSSKSDLDQLENSSPNPNPNPNQDSKCSFKCEDFKALEKDNRELKNSHQELKEQFKSLSQQFEEFKKGISSEDHGISMLMPPLRGPPGKPGAKGEIGLEGQKGEIGQNGGQGHPGLIGPKGERGQVGPEGRAGQKGEVGQPGPQGKDGKTGQTGPKGERGRSAPQSTSIRSCSDAMKILSSPRSEKQTIYSHGKGGNTILEVLCDFETDGGGWTIIQKRSSGPKEEFNRTWNEYANGFGSLDGNFWIGLDNIHALTKNGDQELRIELEDFEGEKKYAKYSRFSVSDASDFYKLSISGFSASSTAGDSMINPNYGDHNFLSGMRFSTKDKDNDNIPTTNCADYYGGGGWWYKSGCTYSNLNGGYFEKGETSNHKGILWGSWRGYYYSLAKSEMKIRKRK